LEPNANLEALVDADLDTLATALYVTTDELLKSRPELAPWRPAVGIKPQVSDAELVTLAVLAAMLGFACETRWVRYARAHLGHLFPYLPAQPGYNKRLRRLGRVLDVLIHHLAADTSVFTDDVLVLDSTPVECARSRETVKRSALAGWAEYGYCASHSRYFWGLRLHLVATVHGLPIGYALTGAKADERSVLTELIATDPALARPGAGPSSRTRTTTAETSNRHSPQQDSPCSATPEPGRNPDPAPGCSNPCGRPWNRSSTPSRASSTSNATADAPPPASSSASSNVSWP